MPDKMDARQQRTWMALSKAILVLAKKGPVDNLSMTKLAQAAGIHRSTVYQHASSPSELLAAVLKQDLDALRAQLDLNDLVNLDVGLLQVFLGMLAHMERHEAIYKRELASPQSALSHMVSAHCRESLVQLLGAYELELPAGLGMSREEFLPAATAWLAAGSVQVIHLWLLTPRPRDPQQLARTHAAMLPPWWPSTIIWVNEPPE